MPNYPIDPKVKEALGGAFGGQPSPQPGAPSPEGSDPGMIAQIVSNLFGPPQAPEQPPVDPYQNFANKATGRPSR